MFYAQAIRHTVCHWYCKQGTTCCGRKVGRALVLVAASRNGHEASRYVGARKLTEFKFE